MSIVTTPSVTFVTTLNNAPATIQILHYEPQGSILWDFYSNGRELYAQMSEEDEVRITAEARNFCKENNI